MGHEQLVESLADAVLDGTAVDWTVAETNAGAARSLIRHLRLVESVAQAQRDALPDESWGHLRLLECVGHGSFGEVFRAWDPRLQREVALKLLRAAASDAADPPVLREGRLLARVRHPNVVTIHGAEHIGDHIGLWMELVRGRTLEQMIQSGATFSPEESIAIGLQLCRALSAVHAAGLLHRDIKAQNVMREDDGRIVLMDFGTGTDRQDAASPDLSGTPLYLAPEVLAGEPASVRSDIYSLGVLLHHLLTGDFPVKARTLPELRLAHERDDRVDIQEARGDVPPKLGRVIAKAIDPRPERRHADAATLAADLVALMPHPVMTRKARGLLVAAAIGLVAGGASLASLWSGARSRITSDTPVLAVLPFKDLGGDANSGLVADGLTVSLIQELARVDGLLVNSLQSSLEYKNASSPIAEVGRTLGAGFVVTGSVQLAGGILRASAQLVRTDGTPLWSDSFDRPLASAQQIFQVRDDIARAISNQLRLTLGRGQRRYDQTTLPLPLYYQWIHAETVLSRRGTRSGAEAAQLFEAITVQEPAFAPAWAGLAASLAEKLRLASPEMGLPAATDSDKLRQAAARALELDPMLADAHAAIGAVLASDHQWGEAEAAFARALALNPSRAITYTDFVLSTLVPLRRRPEAIQLLEQARRVDPLSLDVLRAMAIVQVDFGRYDDAIQTSQTILARDATVPWARKNLGRALALNGKLEEALAIFESDPEEWAMLGWVHARMGHREQAEAIAAQHPDRPGRVMFIYAGLGDAERAFAEFSRFAAVTSVWHAMFQVQRAEAAILWKDPRVIEMRRKFGLPPL